MLTQATRMHITTEGTMQNIQTKISTNVLIDLKRKKFNVHEIHTDENKRNRHTADLQTSILNAYNKT
jgi:hypothetical protein